MKHRRLPKGVRAAKRPRSIENLPIGSIICDCDVPVDTNRVCVGILGTALVYIKE